MNAKLKKALTQEDIYDFGLRTLLILQAHEEWSSSTTDEISLEAMNLGLATGDKDGMFKMTARAKALAKVRK